MRFLVLSAAFLGLAAAAPSNLFPIVALPAAIPTIPPGDIQAAAIDAKVAAEDHIRELQEHARALEDQARELSEKAGEQTVEKVTESDDLAKEKAGETFWNEEEKKWQAYDSLNTAQAQLDGLAANSSPLLAKSVINSAFVIPPAPFLAPIVVPGIVTPKIEEPIAVAKIAEAPKEDKPIVKTAELNEEKKDDKKAEELDKPALIAPIALAQTPLLAPVSFIPGIGFVPFPNQILTPSLVRAW